MSEHRTTRFTPIPAIACALVVAAMLAGCGNDDSAKKADDSRATALKDVPAGTIAFRRFLDAEQTHAALFTISSHGEDENQITKPPDHVVDAYPEWSPDGKNIAFDRAPVDSPYEIHVVGADGSGEHLVDPGCPPRISSKDICDESQPEWSPDGKTLHFGWAAGAIRQVNGVETIEVAGIGTASPDGSGREAPHPVRGSAGNSRGQRGNPVSRRATAGIHPPEHLGETRRRQGALRLERGWHRREADHALGAEGRRPGLVTRRLVDQLPRRALARPGVRRRPLHRPPGRVRPEEADQEQGRAGLRLVVLARQCVDRLRHDRRRRAPRPVRHAGRRLGPDPVDAHRGLGEHSGLEPALRVHHRRSCGGTARSFHLKAHRCRRRP